MRQVNGIFVPDKSDLAYISAHYGKFSNIEICEHLGISAYVLNKIVKQYLLINQKKKHPITMDEEKFVVENFADMDTKAIAAKLGIGVTSVRKIADRHDLHKSEEFLIAQKEKMDRMRLRKVDMPCCGRFCERKETCHHYKSYLQRDKPTYGLLQNGWTTKCINEGNFTFYVESV